MSEIVVLDGYTLNPGDLDWIGLEVLGTVTVYERTPLETKVVIERIGNASYVFTNKTPIDKQVLDACPRIQFIGMLSTGYNVVDIEAAKEKGIPVCNVPTYGTYAVGQFAIAMLLEICHHVAYHSEAVYAGKWEHATDWCFWDYPLIELCGKTMGIIGFGRIGQSTGAIAKAMGMQVLAYDTYETESGKDIGTYVELEELFQKSDVIAVHCPLFPETEGIICKENIQKMKDGVIILNNSRGALVVEQDLADALNTGKVYAAGLDVVLTEPIQKSNPLLEAKNCIITPHISWAPKESRRRLMDIAVGNLNSFLQGEARNVVNP